MAYRRWKKKMSEFKDLVIKIIYNETQKGKMLGGQGGGEPHKQEK